MKVEEIYTCLADPVRLRIANLLLDGPLCGCMIEEIVGVSQVKVSKQLAYLKKLGAVDSKREANWVMYFLSEPVPTVLAENLKLLRSSAPENAELANDLKKRREQSSRIEKEERPIPPHVKKRCCCLGKFLGNE
jgi:DNA-binding transcriptional ArsR family regulator